MLITIFFFENCFFDTTTTQKTSGTGSGTSHSSASTDITGRTTEEMIKLESWSDWGAQDNVSGKASGTGNESSPWYIDDKITYPYFYYQYDGLSSDATNYLMGALYYSEDNGATYQVLQEDWAGSSVNTDGKVYVGDEVTYTITANNPNLLTGDSVYDDLHTWKNVTVTDTLPD